MNNVSQLTEKIIGAAIDVHRTLGPGLLEGSYESALCVELEERRMQYLRQQPIPLTYKGRSIGEYRLDLLVENAVIVEVKAVERFDPVHSAQLLTYLPGYFEVDRASHQFQFALPEGWDPALHPLVRL